MWPVPKKSPGQLGLRGEGDDLVVARSVSDSGCVYVPWQIEDRGECILSTAMLIERQRPYLLEVELARGLIHRIRNRLFVWEWLGLETPDQYREELQEATRQFSLAATSQQNHAEAAAVADRAIRQGLAVAEKLVNKYAEQAIAGRQSQAPISALLGVSLGTETPSVEVRRQLVEACNIVQLPIAWRAIEMREGKRDWKPTDEQLAWTQKAGLKVAAGPLLRMDDVGVPDWLYLWEGDFENLTRLMLEHVHAVVSRYAGRVHLWHVASRVNSGKPLSLDEEQRLHLVAQALEVVQQLDPRTPAVISFDQPWAEYLSDQDEDLAPLHYADALVRADLGVSGFGLEINAGFHPGGSAHRPVFEFGRLLDQWSMWGLPLMVSLCTANESSADPLAKKGIEVGSNGSLPRDEFDPQRQWAGAILPLMLARSTVQVILWNQLTDQIPHEFPRAGLYDATGNAKPTLDLMRDLRKSCLQ